VLLAKGTTRVALYGVGNIREDRMQRMFQADKVRFRRPAAGAGATSSRPGPGPIVAVSTASSIGSSCQE
jgi:hypothetical protein